jgi:hypothetical protein
MRNHVGPLPADAPQEGETYRHYKQGDRYRVKTLALHSNDEEWMVVYEPLYANPDAPLFTRPLREWRERVQWEGKSVTRFTLV